jgi:uncharacterized protein YecE (DUF72 family)
VERTILNPRDQVLRLGTAGWTIPGAQSAAFPAEGSHLERYSRLMNAVEINSTFHRPHRHSTYVRWAASVPDTFRFCLKVPKAITHTAKLVNAEPLLDTFLQEASLLGEKLTCLLVQLAPSHAFDAAVARSFFSGLRKRFEHGVACEPRHATWFTPQADRVLARYGIARVAADPAPVEAAAHTGGCDSLRYFRWHGSPRRYYSSYPEERLAALAQVLQSELREARTVWCIFDNTVTGAALANALSVRDAMQSA